MHTCSYNKVPSLCIVCVCVCVCVWTQEDVEASASKVSLPCGLKIMTNFIIIISEKVVGFSPSIPMQQEQGYDIMWGMQTISSCCWLTSLSVQRGKFLWEGHVHLLVQGWSNTWSRLKARYWLHKLNLQFPWKVHVLYHRDSITKMHVGKCLMVATSSYKLLTMRGRESLKTNSYMYIYMYMYLYTQVLSVPLAPIIVLS